MNPRRRRIRRRIRKLRGKRALVKYAVESFLEVMLRQSQLLEWCGTLKLYY